MTITDVRVVPLGLDHAPAMLKWMMDPFVSQNIGLRQPPTLERTVDWLERAARSDDTRAFAILGDGLHVGNVILDRLDPLLMSARLSIYIGERDARGSGVGRRALSLALRFGFEDWSLKKIWLIAHAENPAAIAAYLKVGFALEGILREEFLLGARRLSAIYMGLLAHEWRASQHARLERPDGPT